MNHGLNFKTKQTSADSIENFMNTPSPLDIWPLESVNSSMVEQKAHSQKSIGYIDRKKDRWKYIREFANNHQTVFKKECRDFYKNNPQEFEKEVRRIEKISNISFKLAGVFACLGVMALVAKWNVLAIMGFGSVFMSAAWGATGVTVSQTLKKKGMEKTRLTKNVFLSMFYEDKNLKDLWFSSDNDTMGFSLLCKKAQGKKEKELNKINAYKETATWLKQWSRGDLDNLSEVEWRALKGIVKKYKRFLTPMNSTALKSENLFQD